MGYITYESAAPAAHFEPGEATRQIPPGPASRHTPVAPASAHTPVSPATNAAWDSFLGRLANTFS